ncbi:hypothetical protein NL676_010863 [Syzygium grande]|nr:hypothetical protein NL676_010863 [Syzygium grande]
MTAEVMTLGYEPITVLDVAVMAAQDKLVSNLVKHLPLESNVWIFRSALYNAARRGRISMVKALVDRFDAEPESVDLALSYAIANAPMQKEWSQTQFLGKCISKCISLCFVDTSFDNSNDMKMAQAFQWFKISLWNLATTPAPFIKKIENHN